jgi:hypothetical protein
MGFNLAFKGLMYSHPQHSVTLNTHVKLRKLNVTYVNTQDK